MAQLFGVSVEEFLSGSKSLRQKEVRGMKSLTELYKIGRGPSSSHTMGPEKACKMFMGKYPEFKEFQVVLYGSLAKTGKGHSTDLVIKKTFLPFPYDVVFNFTKTDIPHPNTMDIIGLKDGVAIITARVISIGGGSISFENEDVIQTPDVYREHTFNAIASYCKEHSIRLWQYALEQESPDFLGHMREVWADMKRSILKGLDWIFGAPSGTRFSRELRARSSAVANVHRKFALYRFPFESKKAKQNTTHGGVLFLVHLQGLEPGTH